MSFGYNLALTPLHTLMLYNAVANGGKMMKPYLVNTVLKDGKRVRSFSPETKIESVCSPQTLSQLKECLEGVVIEGTGKSMASPFYAIAGKTGTALVANGTRGYADHIYQSSFAGYFPADNPQYSCIVVIKNKPFARIYYGALIAGPVFKEIADKLYSNNLEALPACAAVPVKDSTLAYWAGWKQDFQKVFGKMNMGYTDSSLSSKWTYIQRQNDLSTARELQVVRHSMPNVIGMGLKDALYMLENMNLKVVAKGMGKVSQQSLAAGTSIADGQTVYIDLN
jgi:cell division protein FtsI (penicillin-binding protein 3)